MAECKPNPGCDLSAIREAVCIHTSKVMDACRDKDCIEDLRVYLTRDSQAILDGATTVRARSAEPPIASASPSTASGTPADSGNAGNDP